MNNKGFTLIELMSVIVLLAIIVTIAVPSSLKISKKIKENMFCAKIDGIETSAKLYGEDRKTTLNGNINGFRGERITVKTLVDTGYLKKDQNTEPFIVDPRDQKSSNLYNMSLGIFVKNNRIYVEFNDDIKKTCEK